jgi:hypothetical protein
MWFLHSASWKDPLDPGRIAISDIIAYQRSGTVGQFSLGAEKFPDAFSDELQITSQVVIMGAPTMNYDPMDLSWRSLQPWVSVIPGGDRPRS